MPIVIDDPETLRQLERLANLTGESMEEAVIVAMRERLQLLRGEKTWEELTDESWAIVERNRRRRASRSPEASERTSESERE